ncbi:hypothetical protein CURTO8I2_130073 [Curtobacterium sp. 8I-2]|nr:hypothetical protein CURTO8I2_130073 [Curtobacterium sp. 8I-2]
MRRGQSDHVFEYGYPRTRFTHVL